MRNRTSKSLFRTRSSTAFIAPAALRPCRFATPSQARCWLRSTSVNGWTPRSDAIFVSPLARKRTSGKQSRLAATGDYAPSLRSPWRAADVTAEEVFRSIIVLCRFGLPGEIDLTAIRSQADLGLTFTHVFSVGHPVPAHFVFACVLVIYHYGLAAITCRWRNRCPMSLILDWLQKGEVKGLNPPPTKPID